MWSLVASFQTDRRARVRVSVVRTAVLEAPRYPPPQSHPPNAFRFRLITFIHLRPELVIVPERYVANHRSEHERFTYAKFSSFCRALFLGSTCIMYCIAPECSLPLFVESLRAWKAFKLFATSKQNASVGLDECYKIITLRVFFQFSSVPSLYGKPCLPVRPIPRAIRGSPRS